MFSTSFAMSPIPILVAVSSTDVWTSRWLSTPTISPMPLQRVCALFGPRSTPSGEPRLAGSTTFARSPRRHGRFRTPELLTTFGTDPSHEIAGQRRPDRRVAYRRTPTRSLFANWPTGRLGMCRDAHVYGCRGRHRRVDVGVGGGGPASGGAAVRHRLGLLLSGRRGQRGGLWRAGLAAAAPPWRPGRLVRRARGPRLRHVGLCRALH